MSSAIDQKAYLQKYLGGSSSVKKKKKKKVVKGKGFKIIDDDIDLSKLRPLEGDELDILGEGEDAPQVAGIIDERPEEVRKLEQFKTSSKWRVINQDDGFNSKLQIEEIKRDIKEKEKENELVFGKMYSDSEDEKKNDSDLSPPRKQSNVPEKSKGASKNPNNSDSDFSPPRRNREESPKQSGKNSDSDPSPPRKHETQRSKERTRKPSRWGESEKSESKSRQRSPDSPRRSKKQRPSQSPKRSKRKSPDSGISPPRKAHKQNDEERRSRKDSPKKRNRSPDSDESPPRKRKQSPDQNRNGKYNNRHTIDRVKRDGKSSDSDLSPPRKNNKRKKSPSPPRKSRKHSPERNQNKRKHDSDSDLSPPRKTRDRNENRQGKRKSDSPPPSNKKMARTLDGKMAGLQDARQLRQENQAFRLREEEAFNKMGDEVSGRNAQAVSRKSKRETSEDRQKLVEKVERQKELDEKYKKWGQGLKQIGDQESRVQEYLHEASKPLARHRGDADLEDRLRDVERDGDPMLRYMRERKRERGELGPEKPMYKGNFPPNRFNIRPGYRWDGVDRSNGYEKKFFDQQSKRKAQEEEAYKWSTEDL